MADDFAKTRVHFRRTAGEVKGVHGVGINDLMQQGQAFVGHGLGAGRPGIHMAMQAALVAAVGQVDLQP